MKKEYDLARMKSRKNPYAARLKRQVTIRINIHAIDYFKNMAKETGLPYQQLIDSYLSDCVQNQRKLSVAWR
jgi:predicted DNA binding CopG/RHH family protein